MNIAKILEKNIDRANRELPGLGIQFTGSELVPEHVQCLKAKSGHDVLKVRKKNNTWLSLHSLVDPLTEARNFVRGISLSPDNITVVFGAAVGYHIHEILDKFSGQTFIIVENDEYVLKYFLSRIDLAKQARTNNIFFVCTGGVEEAVNRISRIQIFSNLKPFNIVEYPPSVRTARLFYSTLKQRLTAGQAINIYDKLRYAKFKHKHLNVLILHSKYYLLGEIHNSLKKMGHQTLVVMVHGKKEGTGAQHVLESIISHIVDFKPDFVLTVNHLGFDREGILAKFFSDIEMPFASWYVDSPVFILEDYKKQLSDYLAVFLWDRDYLEDLSIRGFQNIFYLPLATDPDIFKNIPENENKLNHLRCNMGFVGSSGENVIMECLADLKDDPEAINLLEPIAQQFLHSPARYPHMMTPDLSADEMDVFNRLVRTKPNIFEPAVTWRASQIYRNQCLQKILSYRPRIHGDPGWNRHVAGKAMIGSELNYYEELPLFYNVCTINFNTTSLQMKHGINQRVFDVPSCRAFLLTDYRTQLEELFEIGKEVICYREQDEIEDLLNFYLKNNSSRQNVIRRSHERVINEHTYGHRLTFLINRMKILYG